MALFSFDPSLHPFIFSFSPLLFSIEVCESLGAFLTVESGFTINLGAFLLCCVTLSPVATVGSQAWTHKAGNTTPGLWTIKNSWNHRTLIDESPLKGCQLSTESKLHQKAKKLLSFSKRRAQLWTLTDRLLKAIPKSQPPQNKLLDMALPSRETRLSSIHQNAGTSHPNKETFTWHLSNPIQQGLGVGSLHN